jgi:hypothetical protein
MTDLNLPILKHDNESTNLTASKLHCQTFTRDHAITYANVIYTHVDIHTASSSRSSLINSVRQLLDGILPALDEHDRHARYFPDSALQVSITRGHDEYSVLLDVVHDTVVGVCALVLACYPLKPGVFRQSDGHLVFVAEFL